MYHRWLIVIYDNQSVHQVRGTKIGDDTSTSVNDLLSTAYLLAEQTNMFLQIYDPKKDVFTGLPFPPELDEFLRG